MTVGLTEWTMFFALSEISSAEVNAVGRVRFLCGEHEKMMGMKPDDNGSF